MIKIVWLCHFSNREVQDILKPFQQINETAPWITALARFFEDQNDLELHIVSPYEYISIKGHFKLRGIHYHFFNGHIPLWGRHWPGFLKFDYWSNFFFNKYKVRQIINRISPDLIHLHGAENAYYSSSIIQFKDKYPVLVTVQGFVSYTISKDHFQIKKRIYYEQEIMKHFTHFGYRTKTMGKDILSFNPEAILHWHCYPFTEIKPFEIEKKYDIVFFARVCMDKGIDDLLKALLIIKKQIQYVKLCVIGSASSFYKNMAEKLGVSENIYWAGFLPTQSDVHKVVSAARISVLPTYNEIISGTIIESLFLKIPVVAYDVGSIHEINENEEIVSLVEKANIEGLAEAIIQILKDEKRQTDIAEKGFRRAQEMFDNTKIYSDIMNAYSEVIRDFNNNILN